MENYISVRLNTIKTNLELGFNLYIKLPSKYIHYIKSSDSLDDEVKKNLKSKKIRKLFIPENEEEKYLEFLDRCLSDAMDDSSLTQEQKNQLLISVSKDLSQSIYTKEVDQKSYKSIQKAGVALIDVLESDSDILKQLYSIKSSEEDSLLDKILNHGVSTSSLCVSFATFLGLPKEEIEVLSMAGLMHDMAFMKMPEHVRPLFFKDVKEMNGQELSDYKVHPTKGVELLSDKPFANKLLIDLIATHEEKISGEGFPKKLTKLTPLQEVHSLCCHFDRRVTCLGEEKANVIDDMMVGELGNYKMDLLKKFKQFLAKSLKD